MYEQEAMVPMEYKVLILKTAMENQLDDSESLKERFLHLNKLDKTKNYGTMATEVVQRGRKCWHNKHLQRMNFTPRQLNHLLKNTQRRVMVKRIGMLKSQK